jgi:hypothetical protein
MKTILLSNISTEKPGGTEMWTRLMAEYFYTNGYTVHIYTKNIGEFSKTFNGKIITNLSELYNEYDYIICNHYICTKECNYIIGPKLQTIHGCIPKDETPYIPVKNFISITSEIQTYLSNTYNIISNIIPNPVVVSKTPEYSTKVKKVYSLCQNNELNNRIQHICEQNKIEFKCNNKFNTDTTNNTLDFIKWSDVCISIGRGIYEAMGQGKGCVVLDSRPYSELYSDGNLHINNLINSYSCNFSGRYYKIKPTDDMILSYIMDSIKYNKILHAFANEFFRIDKIAESYINQLTSIQ